VNHLLREPELVPPNATTFIDTQFVSPFFPGFATLVDAWGEIGPFARPGSWLRAFAARLFCFRFFVCSSRLLAHHSLFEFL
jgi:hypothetical protein